MKVLIASDLHGSFEWTNKLIKVFNEGNFDLFVLLGDLYYHGPRNPFPDNYAPMQVCEALNSVKDKLIVTKGNCDAEVDEMISEFKFEDHILTEINGKKTYFTHGHKYNIEVIPYDDFEILIYGHIHQGFIEEKEGYLFANPGSISLPKGGTRNSYLVLDEDGLTLKDVEGEILQEYKF
jgi:putative phosphoesterase